MADRTTYLAPNSEAAFRPKANTFRAREIQPDQGKQAMIKSWLDICRREHKGACSVTTQQAEFERLVDETYFGVIDVTDLQLKPLPRTRSHKPAKFVALSYVWGQSDKPYITTRHNILWRRQHGGLETDLHNFPAAIRDAIKLVQKLHMRYLWVDALCIVQDSAASFRLNASEMHTIYGNAHFTICAADGIDADTGLRAMARASNEDIAQQDTEEVIPGLRLQIARPPEMVIKDSKWNTRGWTFQERILSRRCVIFADSRVYFQCRKAAFSEDVHNEIKGSGWSFQAMGAPLRSFAEIEQRSFSFYMRCVAMFYRRDLTRPSDILAAFKGIQSVMELVMGAPFCFGLPTSHFDLALLWQPTQAVRRRLPAPRTQPSECTTTHDGHCDCKLEGDDFNGQEFPSWSWSGWVGGDIAYDHAALEGSLLTVREWLKTHTWIRYHVLGGRGKLRPLWDATKVFEDASTEDRWKGYLGCQVRHDEYLSRSAVQYDTDSEEDMDSPVGVQGPQRVKTVRYDAQGNPFTDIRILSQPEPGYRYLQRKPQMNSRECRADSDEQPMEYPRRPNVLDIELRERPRVEYRRRSPGPVYRTSPSPPLYPQDDRKVSESVSSTPLSAGHDSWGRLLNALPVFEQYRRDHFTRSHPENPYRVRKTEWSWPDVSRGFPDLPILQFWTRLKQFRVVAAGSEIRGTGLTRCHIADTADDWCGTVTVNTDWIEQHDGQMVEFIALSEAKAFTEDENPD
ncbi:hypothetical protein AMS68_004386 [Peltaster fructicola]|uniref:Heterokaryon incompatibility domain-containing protein n=1 Tax=Peltaster fructicola TaxID=286661 RepID=A0A6H0XW77_9PEZI|nr:hypothetical protein AMS68_004386 [Peltaster fructicola]